MQIIIDNRVVHYQQAGSGRVVLLLHGWGDSLSTFKHLQAELSKGYAVTSIDLPGFGQSQPPDCAWGLRDYAVFLKQFLAKIGVADIYAVIGHSNGGAIAIEAIGSGNLRCERLVLLASSGVRNTDTGKKQLLKFATKLGKGTTAVLPRSARSVIRRKLYRTVGSDMLVAEHMTATFKKIISEDIQNTATQITTPSLLIYGANDTATPTTYGKALHEKIHGSKLVVLKDSGHFVHHDQTAEVQQAIIEFLG